MKVAVVGATGLVGSKMLEVLAQRNFPVTELLPVASERSVGKEVLFKQEGVHRLNGLQNLQRPVLQSLIIQVHGAWIPPKSWWYRR